MSCFIQPIYDRDADDITARNSKAFFNVVDWIRVNGNTQYLNALATLLRLWDIDFTELPEPDIATIPTAEDINQFVENIDRIREILSFPSATGIVALKHDYAGTLSEIINYETVNNWERDIELLRSCLIASIDWTVYCGVSRVGQLRFYQVQFRQWEYVEESATPSRLARCCVAETGTGLQRQNSFRRYA